MLTLPVSTVIMAPIAVIDGYINVSGVGTLTFPSLSLTSIASELVALNIVEAGAVVEIGALSLTSSRQLTFSGGTVNVAAVTMQLSLLAVFSGCVQMSIHCVRVCACVRA